MELQKRKLDIIRTTDMRLRIYKTEKLFKILCTYLPFIYSVQLESCSKKIFIYSLLNLHFHHISLILYLSSVVSVFSFLTNTTSIENVRRKESS